MTSKSQRDKRLGVDSATTALVARLSRDYLRRHVLRIALAVLCMIAVALATAAFPKLIQPVIDEIFVARRAEMLWPIALAALAVFVVRGLATYGQAVLMTFIGQSIVARMQNDLFRRLIGADLAFYSESSPGGLVARFINDVNLLRNAASSTLTGLGKDALTAAALIAVMFYEDWLLATVAFVAFPTAVLPILGIGRRLRRISGRTQQHIGRLTTLLDETFQGIRHVKAYGMEDYETARAEDAIDELFRLNVKAAKTRNALHPIMEILGGLAVVAVILYGGHQVIAGAKAPGSFFAFIFALLLAYEPVKRLAGLNAALQEGLAAAERVFALLDMEPEIKECPSARNLKVTGGQVALEGVTFAYGKTAPALYDVDLMVPAGATVALVGPSGAGKSSVLNLIPRFYDPARGRVAIDGQDVREVTFESLRGAIALVSQEILLFDDTLRANIAYGRPGAGQAEIEAAARHAGAADFIAALPQGHDTLVGPRGVKLSGGQRQRIAIARALLKNAPILLLDEATSALDSESEAQVQGALETLMAGRTTLVIAHRLSTVRDADLIYVLEAGRVVECGKHAELLARGGSYARLHALQFAAAEARGERDVAAAERARA
ncbi:MAG: ABC transporter ATP-binding protein/permease [Rhodospirillales bacterium]|nr:ABC transporter ATP-binding protein/permease [Rhodospirillales bacterium]